VLRPTAPTGQGSTNEILCSRVTRTDLMRHSRTQCHAEGRVCLVWVSKFGLAAADSIPERRLWAGFPSTRAPANGSATGSTAAATASSTAPPTASRSPKAASIHPHAPTSNANKQKARAAAKPSAPQTPARPDRLRHPQKRAALAGEGAVRWGQRNGTLKLRRSIASLITACLIRASEGAWADLIIPLMPPVPATILDVGCGTGSLSVLLAQEGHNVHGIDFSEGMVAAARAKADAAGVAARFEVDDAQTPSVKPASIDVVLGRHILWALPNPRAALARWIAALREPGLLVLVEGHWSTGAGLTAAECERLVQPLRREITITQLDNPVLWGRPTTDERYMVVSHT